MHTHVREGEGTPEKGREYTQEKEGEKEMIARKFFSFANTQSAENRNNCKFTFAEFVLFSRKKKLLWPKISIATVNLN